MGTRTSRFSNIIALESMSTREDDFFVTTRNKMIALYSSAKKAGIRIRSEKQEDGNYKIWRVG